MGPEHASSELTILAYIQPPRAIISQASFSVEAQIKALKEGSRTLQAPAIPLCLSGALSFSLVSADMQGRFRWARTRLLVQPTKTTQKYKSLLLS